MRKFKRYHERVPWLARLPQGLRDQPESVFIGLLCLLTGVSYAVGLSGSRLTERLNNVYLSVWGVFLALSGALIIFSVIKREFALEILSRRLLTICLIVFTVWATVIVGVLNAALTIMLSAALVCLGEIRIAVLRLLIRSVDR